MTSLVEPEAGSPALHQIGRRAGEEKAVGAPLRSRWPEWTTVFLYAAVIAYAIPFHEPWADEAQAWQLARSLPLSSLFHTYLRYEASPGLWHFLLWILVRLHVSYSGMHWVCGAIGVVGTWFLVFRSPFPRYLKLTLPFTYFLLFQYAVVARNYALAPLLLYLIAIRWKKNPIVLALLLGLLANVALHTAVISGGLAMAWLIQQRVGIGLKIPTIRRRWLIASIVLIAFYAFAIWTAKAPPDMIARFRGTSHAFTTNALGSVLFGICEPMFLSVLFWMIFVIWLIDRRALPFLIPCALFAIFSGAAHVEFWHLGLLIPLVICILWVNWQKSSGATSQIDIFTRAAVMVLALTQILWCGYALAYDHTQLYSPAAATAEFLRPFVREHATIAVTFLDSSHHALPNAPEADAFFSVGVQPYFQRPIFVNRPYPFWNWREETSTNSSFNASLSRRPQIVLVEIPQNAKASPDPQKDSKVQLLNRDGYRLTNTFCGKMPMRFRAPIGVCTLIFRYKPESNTLTQ